MAHPCGSRQPAPGRQQALQQAGPHPQRVPSSRGTPERGRSRRPDPPRRPAHQPRHRLPHAAVDGRGRHRAQGGLRRGPLPLRALLPASAPLPPDLQDLQPVVRVPQLGHRGADRGDRRRARTSPPGRACCRSTAPARSAGPAGRGRRTPVTTELLFARDALRIAIATERSGLEFYSRAARAARDARGRSVFQKLAERSGSTWRRSRRATSGCSRRIRELESRPTFLFFKGAANGLFAAGAEQLARGVDDQQALMIGIRCERGVAPVLQALRRAVRGLRRQADLPGVRQRGTRAPRAARSASTARWPGGRGARATRAGRAAAARAHA